VSAPEPVRRSHPLDPLGVALIAFGLLNLLTALGLAFTPGSFFESVGPYGVRNDHYMGDLAAYYAALGLALLAAARWPTWRVPVLAIAVVEGLLHAVNHLVDLDEANPAWLGPFNFIALVVLGALLVLLLVAATRGTSFRRR
jgi:hypothetical protein